MDNADKQILNIIEIVFNKSKGCKLTKSFLSQTEAELSFLSEYFRTTKSQAFFIVLVFEFEYRGQVGVNLKHLTNFLNCEKLQLYEFIDEVNALISTGIFKNEEYYFGLDSYLKPGKFTLDNKIREAIYKNVPLPEIQPAKASSVFEILEKIYKLGRKNRHHRICVYELYNHTENLINSNLHIPLLNKVRSLDLDIEAAYLFLFLVWRTLLGCEYSNVRKALKDIYIDAVKDVNNMLSFVSGENVLIKKGLIEITDTQFYNDIEMKLTDYSFLLLAECEINLLTNKKKKKYFMPIE